MSEESSASPPPSGATKIIETGARDVSAVTVGRMMGLATASDVQLLEGKLDLLTTKVTALTVRLEKLGTLINELPGGSDLERIDVQIAALRTMIREVLTTGKSSAEAENPSGAKQASQSQASSGDSEPRATKARPKIFTNSSST